MAEIKEEYFRELLLIKNDLEKFAVFLTRNRDTAKELASEVIISGYDGFHRLKDLNSFKNYVFTICIRTYYKIKKQNSKFESLKDNDFDTLYDGMNSDELYDLKLLYSAIDKLKKEEKEIFILAELLGYKYKDITQICNISEANVKIRVFRAKNKLVDYFKDRM